MVSLTEMRVFGSVLLTALSFSIWTPSVYADQAALSQWADAKRTADSGKVEDAFRILQEKPRPEDPYYFYNLGTLAYRLGRLGPSLAYLEKANRMKRHDSDIRNNLEIVRASVARGLGGIDRMDPASTWSENFADQLALDEIRGVLGLLGVIVALFWMRAYLKSRRLRSTLLHPAALLASVTLLIVGSLYWIERTAAAHAPAISLTKQTLRSGPGSTFIDLGSIESGTKVRLLGPSAEEKPPTDATPGKTPDLWLQVRFSQEGIGWLRAADLFALK